MGTKTDNGNLEEKLELRRYFMRKYHSDGQARVFDCCQGSGVIWSTLQKEFKIANYWGVNVKTKPGRLKIESSRVLAQPGWSDNVIDVDTYGSPWAHWAAILANLQHSATVFLTIGQVNMRVSNLTLEALGLGSFKIPPSIALKLQEIALSALLTRGCVNCKLGEVQEAVATGHARYIGVRLEKLPRK